ncbi:MAG: endolytic transglycosylase MltG, partial [Alphaproteobacteria bacterium]|nr:endolytic transglycosylase MltG [Alphaproteobacteria bacterium]
MRFLGDLVSLILLIAVVAVGCVIWLAEHTERAGPHDAEALIDIAPGSSIATIGDTLEAAGVIDNPDLFAIAACLLAADGSLKAGEYAVPAHESMREVIARLSDGRVLTRRITIPEGLTAVEIVAIVAATPALEGEVSAIPPEGSLLPETYHYLRGDTRDAVLARMTDAMAATLTELWAARAENLPFDTPEEAVILASVVEKETGVSGERRHVAGVFVNRLRRGMRLQSDPTVIYGLTGGTGPLGRALTRADLAAPHPYNTYLIDGLPPHPIANPGAAAIAAVLDPLETEDLYFVADGTGGHVFARTLEEHNRNAAAWRRIRDGQ